MYIICYIDLQGTPKWEGIDGEDAMQERVDVLCNVLNCDEDEIFVFESDSML